MTIQIVVCLRRLGESPIIADGPAKERHMSIVTFAGRSGHAQHHIPCDEPAGQIAALHRKHAGAAQDGIAAIAIERKTAGGGSAGGIHIAGDVQRAGIHIGPAAAGEGCAVQFMGAQLKHDRPSVSIHEAAG